MMITYKTNSAVDTKESVEWYFWKIFRRKLHCIRKV